MVCAVILYCGFLMSVDDKEYRYIFYLNFFSAGWVIIGPYSMKVSDFSISTTSINKFLFFSQFRTLSQSSEALFSLLNGDDMFATFYTISDTNKTIKVFGTIYIYAFVSLFIYVVLSLFIAIIMDAYEVGTFNNKLLLILLI
jgi:hypothetical protein